MTGQQTLVGDVSFRTKADAGPTPVAPHEARPKLGPTQRSRAGRLTGGVLASAILLLVVGACTSPSEQPLPPEVQDPAALQNSSGAVARYRGAVSLLPAAADQLLALTGILTDELAALPMPAGVVGGYTMLDSRLDLQGDFETLYNQLHRLRGQAQEARGFLTAYAPDSSAALAGHLYAMQGWAELGLADLFCSGIPLSTVDFNGDYTLAPGSSTAAVYEHAMTLLDSAIALSGDSVRVQQFAAVERGRALLALGQYAAAAAAVASVPDVYQYQVSYTPSPSGLTSPRLLERFWALTTPGIPSMADGEGVNGLDYRSSGDPRTVATARPTPDKLGHTLYFPVKYPTSGAVTLTVASGIEARLIEAEWALQAGDVSTWLAKLNALRTGGTVIVPADTIIDTLGITQCGAGRPICGGPPGGDDPSFGQPAGGFPGYSVVDADTTSPTPPGIQALCDARAWYEPCYTGQMMVVFVLVKPEHEETPPGTGGFDGLAALTDPGTPEGRVDLMFRERAFWLYLTGHRQGDLRRLIRQYHRSASAVYPTGAYPGGTGLYGTEIVAPVPFSEQTLNPKYSGCRDHNA